MKNDPYLNQNSLYIRASRINLVAFSVSFVPLW